MSKSAKTKRAEAEARRLEEEASHVRSNEIEAKRLKIDAERRAVEAAEAAEAERRIEAAKPTETDIDANATTRLHHIAASRGEETGFYQTPQLKA